MLYRHEENTNASPGYYARPNSMTIDGENKVFHDKTKFTHYFSMNPALQRIITKKKKTTTRKNNTRMETMP